MVAEELKGVYCAFNIAEHIYYSQVYLFAATNRLTSLSTLDQRIL